jgi:hypothetical protein
VITVSSSGGVTLYVNGSNAVTGTVTQNTASGTQFFVGRRSDAGGNKFSGYISDMRTYNKVLSATAVSTMYTCGPNDYNISVSGGANVIELNASVNVYPTPASTELNFLASEAISGVEIYGMDGKLALSATTTTVDITSLPNGIYHYSVMTVSGKVLKGKVSKI